MRQRFAVATWLLRTFDAGPHAEAIAGDLVERLGEGRSRFWFWRQVVVALATGTWREARDHASAVVLGSLAGWAFLWFFISFVAVQIVEIDRLLFITGLVGTYTRWQRWHVVAPWVVFCAGFIKAGWLAARAARIPSMAPVSTFAATVTAAMMVMLALDPDTARTPDPTVPFWLPIAFLLTAPSLGIVLGGLLSQHGRLQTSRGPVNAGHRPHGPS